MIVTSTKDVNFLNELYKDRDVYQGEMHDHAQTGGTSDGLCTLSHWIGALDALKMDFAAILDHRQVRHMYLPEWKDGLFVAGTEAATKITDSKATVKGLHYNVITPNSQELEQLLSEFPEFEFTGGSEGHFKYPPMTTARFCELIEAIKAHGGFFVHPHPSSVMKSDDPLDYWFCDETGFEIFYYGMFSKETQENYRLWTALLDAGKYVWAIAGGDGHAVCSDEALTTIYAKEKSTAGYLEHLRVGDFTCGGVGIRMAINETKMGGKCSFKKARLRICIGDFHRSVLMPEHTYRFDMLNENGVVFSKEITCTEPSYFAFNTEKCKFYRAEVFDVTRNVRIAIGNPIWNTDEE